MTTGPVWISLLFVSIAIATPLEQGTCEFGDHIYQLGDTWHPFLLPTGIDRCTTCTCIEHDKVTCLRDECPDPGCPNPRRISGHCCPQCIDEDTYTEQPEVPLDEERSIPGCQYKGKSLRHGDLFSVDDIFTSRRADQCVQCGCTLGRIYCALKTCLPLSCPQNEQVIFSDSCCPVCLYADESVGSEDAFHPAEDTEPTSNGLDEMPLPNILLETNDVPVLNNFPSVPVAGHDVSSGNAEESASQLVCESNGQTFRPGQTWHPVLFPFGRMDCILCRCEDGETLCDRITCPLDNQLPCRNPQYVPDQCCKVCTASSDDEVTPPPPLCLQRRETTLLYSYQPTVIDGPGDTRSVMYALEHLPTNRVEIRKWELINGDINNFLIEEISSGRFERAQDENREGRFRLMGATTSRRVEKLKKKEARLQRRCSGNCVRQVVKLPKVLAVREVQRSNDCDRTRWQTRPRREQRTVG